MTTDPSKINQSEDPDSIDDFNKEINHFSISFINPDLEQEYQSTKQKNITRFKGLKIAFSILFFFILARMIEELIFGAFNIELYKRINLALWTMLFLILISLVLEFVIASFNKLKPLKGALSLFSLFLAVSYLSYSVDTDTPITIAT